MVKILLTEYNERFDAFIAMVENCDVPISSARLREATNFTDSQIEDIKSLLPTVIKIDEFLLSEIYGIG